MTTSDLLRGSGSGGSSGGYGSGGGRPGVVGSGAGWGCFAADTMVWTKNESMPDTFATKVMVKNVIEGNLVGTLDTSSKPTENYKFMWTRATDVTIYQGNWNALTITFVGGHHITVT